MRLLCYLSEKNQSLSKNLNEQQSSFSLERVKLAPTSQDLGINSSKNSKDSLSDKDDDEDIDDFSFSESHSSTSFDKEDGPNSLDINATLDLLDATYRELSYTDTDISSLFLYVFKCTIQDPSGIFNILPTIFFITNTYKMDSHIAAKTAIGSFYKNAFGAATISNRPLHLEEVLLSSYSPLNPRMVKKCLQQLPVQKKLLN
jgi:hypothetical protein